MFCHTPHHASTNAPLWNKGVQTTTYSTYGTTLAGTSSDSQPGAATLACLSCHDGVNTFDTIVNFPGKGGTTKADMGWSFKMTGGSPSVLYDHFATWSGTVLIPQPPFYTPPGDPFTVGTCASCHEPTGVNALPNATNNPADRLSLGTDLTNDHPVSIDL